MTLNDVVLNNFQVKQLFEEFNKKLNEPGENPQYSWVIYKNCEILAGAYTQIMQELYDERREPEFPEFYNKQQALIQKYADRNEQNEIIFDRSGNPQIIENIVEFNQENAKLLEEYSELCEKVKNKDKVNLEVYNKTNSYKLYTMELSEFPLRTPPYIVGMIGY